MLPGIKLRSSRTYPPLCRLINSTSLKTLTFIAFWALLKHAVVQHVDFIFYVAYVNLTGYWDFISPIIYLQKTAGYYVTDNFYHIQNKKKKNRVYLLCSIWVSYITWELVITGLLLVTYFDSFHCTLWARITLNL